MKYTYTQSQPTTQNILGNRIGDEGGKAVEEALNINSTLKELGLD